MSEEIVNITVTDYEVDDGYKNLSELFDKATKGTSKTDAFLVNVGNVELKGLTALSMIDQFGLTIPVFVGYQNGVYSNVGAFKLARNHKFKDLGEFINKDRLGELRPFTDLPEFIGERKVRWTIISPLTEVACLFKQYPHLPKQTIDIVQMGGVQPIGGNKTMTYNWGMDPMATKFVLDTIVENNIPTKLLSSEYIKPQIGNSIHPLGAPEVFVQERKLTDFKCGKMIGEMNMAWNNAVYGIPFVKGLIDRVGWEQHCPADIVVHFVDEVVAATKRVRFELVDSEKYETEYYDHSKEMPAPIVNVIDDETSPIELITEFKSATDGIVTVRDEKTGVERRVYYSSVGEEITPQQKFFYDLYEKKLAEINEFLSNSTRQVLV